jgi:hypothetical protein
MLTFIWVLPEGTLVEFDPPLTTFEGGNGRFPVRFRGEPFETIIHGRIGGTYEGAISNQTVCEVSEYLSGYTWLEAEEAHPEFKSEEQFHEFRRMVQMYADVGAELYPWS